MGNRLMYLVPKKPVCMQYDQHQALSTETAGNVYANSVHR